MSVDRALLAGFIRENPFQPATCFWRAIEVGFVVERGLPEGRGLDVACGDGRLLGLLLDRLGRRPEVVGLDLDAREVEAARKTGRYAALHVASADRIPEPDTSFDWAFSNSALEHIGPIEGTLAEVARVLRPGGRFIFTVPADSFHACLGGPLWGDRGKYLAMIDQRCAHLRYWNEGEWRDALDRAGLELTSIEPYLSASEVRRWETLSRLTAGLLYTLLRRQPIEIQRQLGMRRGQRLPVAISRLVGRLIAGRITARTAGPTGCLYVVAERRAA